MSEHATISIPIATVAMDVANWLAEQSDMTQARFLTQFMVHLDDVCGYRGDHQLTCLFAEMSPVLRGRIRDAIL